MPAPGPAELGAPVVRLALCAYLDISGLPLRRCMAPMTLAMPSASILPAADPDFDGQQFLATDPRMVEISPVSFGPGGVEAVSFSASGTLGLDADILNAFSNPALFRGRSAKIWLVRLNDNWQPTHAQAVYHGLMDVPSYRMGPTSQAVTIVSESQRAVISRNAPGRTILSQSAYDPGDLSAAATLGTTTAASSAGPLGPAYGGGSVWETVEWTRLF